MSRIPKLTDENGDDRFYTNDPAGADGVFGYHTVGIVDNEAGGIIAYVHEDNAARIILGLMLAEVAEAGLTK